MRIKAIYENEVLKPLKKLDLKEKTEVWITIRKSFSELLDELGDIEGRHKVLESMRVKNYYGMF